MAIFPLEDEPTYADLSRSKRPFWRADLHSPVARALTLDMVRRFVAQLEARDAGTRQTIITTSVSLIEGAGRSMGWPDLEAHFEAVARGAAHAIFGNIGLDVRAAVTAMAAGRYVLGGEWPFRVVEWSKPRSTWD